MSTAPPDAVGRCAAPLTALLTEPLNETSVERLTEQTVEQLVEQLAERLTALGWRLCTAESCTGGLIAAACTERAGASLWFERGFVTYSNEAKVALLRVDPALLQAHGAVSEPVALAMAEGALGHALAHARAEVAVAVTGVAGPDGGSADKPVGLVCFGFALPGRSWSETQRFGGERATVRAASVAHALARLLAQLPGPLAAPG